MDTDLSKRELMAFEITSALLKSEYYFEEAAVIDAELVVNESVSITDKLLERLRATRKNTAPIVNKQGNTVEVSAVDMQKSRDHVNNSNINDAVSLLVTKYDVTEELAQDFIAQHCA